MDAVQQWGNNGVSAVAVGDRVEIALDGETTRTISWREAQRFAFHLATAYMKAGGLRESRVCGSGSGTIVIGGNR